MLKIIACVSENLAIGKGNNLIFTIPEDMEFFKNTTSGHTVVMGHNTLKSIGRALPGRTNVVLTKEVPSKPIENVQYVTDANELIENIVSLAKNEDVYIIGGVSLYEMFLPYAHELLLTNVQCVATGCDAFFPKFEHIYTLEEESPVKIYIDRNYMTVSYTFQTWVRCVSRGKGHHTTGISSDSCFKDDGTDLELQYHTSKEAMDLLFSGVDIKHPSWEGYWHFNKEIGVVEMHCKDGSVLDIRATDRIEYTMKNIASDKWVVATPGNTPILGGAAWFDFEEAVRYMKRNIKVQSEYMDDDVYLELVEADILVDNKPVGTETHIGLFNDGEYLSYYHPTQCDIFGEWRFYNKK